MMNTSANYMHFAVPQFQITTKSKLQYALVYVAFLIDSQNSHHWLWCFPSVGLSVAFLERRRKAQEPQHFWKFGKLLQASHAWWLRRF